MLKFSSKSNNHFKIFIKFCHQLALLIVTNVVILTLTHTTCSQYRTNQQQLLVVQAQRFVDVSSLKPSIILILPHAFKVPTNPLQGELDAQTKLQQYVAVVNNAQSEREDQLLRQQYKKLTLQVRDAKSPITGQLFYEHVFDYFPLNQQYLLIPINLDQVSTVQEHLVTQNNHGFRSSSYLTTSGNSRNEQTTEPATISQLQQLIVSIRPYQLDSGFGSESIELVSSVPILVEPVPSKDGRRSFTIVQTDKPIYKPNERVRIRGLVVNDILRPVVRDELRLQIKNPHKIVVEEIRFPRSNNETTLTDPSFEPLYLDHVFEFPPEPMLGTWSVHLLHNDPVANDTISFEVKEYVLPPFEIEFNSPKFILPSTQTIVGHIVAKYHYGKPVRGKAQFKFGYRESLVSKPKFIARSSIKTIEESTGRVEYKINADKFKETEWFPNIAGSRFVLEVTITEINTGHRETAQDSSCTFISMPYRISFDDSIEDFKPGLSQQLTVQLVEFQSQQPGPAGERIIAQYRDQNGTLIGTSALVASTKPVDFRERLDSEAITDSLGRATFNIGPIRDDVTLIQVTMKVLNSTKQTSKAAQNYRSQVNSTPSSEFTPHEIANGNHMLMKHESQNGWISLMNKSVTYLNVGDEFVSDLLIRDAVVIPQKIFYLIITRGQIIALDTLNSDGFVNFRITEMMMPSIRIVLFALTRDSIGLLSDSMRINIGQDLNCGLNVHYISDTGDQGEDNTFKPNDRGRLDIHARLGDLVSLIGVDAAVYTLNNRARLDSTRIIQRIKRLDAGCGFGGGRNNLDVFHNAGLMIFRDIANVGPNEAASSYIGSSCLSVINQLKYLEDAQLGYTKPIFAHINRPRALEVAIMQRQRFSLANAFHIRSKREVDVETILRRYKDPLYRSCCRLGTLEDLPQKRNCSVRARIVEKYMRQAEFKSCARIYFDCCRAVFTEHISLGSMVGRSSMISEPISVERVLSPQQQAPQYNEAVEIHPNFGQLDKVEAETLVRKDFRETWLFDLVNVNNSAGIASINVQLPHSITSWSINAIALNQHKPMCLMPKPLQITTFQKIFLQVSMPYKVVQGEQIDLVTSVFNYSPQEQEVIVYMYGVDGVCSEAEPGERSDRKRIRIEKHSSQSVLFPMIPLKTGKYPLKIVAVALKSNQSDIVERQLNVVPRGKPVTDETTFSLDPMNHQRRSKRAIQTGNLVDEIDSTRGLQRSKVRLAPTRDSEYIVPQTQECIVSAIGDKMGQSVQTTMLDVENLIRLPHGCGEQVMIYLGPTLYTTRYLSSINKLTGDLRWRAIRYIQNGYKRILNFRKETGAFSAFARRDPSIWLTAFVSKMLCQTERTPFVAEEIHVDKTVVNSALNWLIDMQDKETGTWIELNPVYHREMLGGVLRENALTAFVTLTLNECAHHSQDLVDEVNLDQEGGQSSSGHTQTNGIDKLKLATQKAEDALMLDRYKAVKERNPYVLALGAYALSFSRPRDAASMLNDLLQIAERSQSRNQLFWRGDYPIETAAYALQALIELAPIVASDANGGSTKANWLPGADAIAIANWLSSRRSYTGAFESTQDTVVALEALSKFAQLQSTPSGNALIPQSQNNSPSLTCNVTINNRTRRSIEFGKENAQILQTFKLDSFDLDIVNGEMLDIVTSGNGLGTMSVKLKYNVFQEDDELCRFNIDSSIDEWQPKISLPGKPSDQLIRDNSKDIVDEIQTNETIEDDYFKTFDKSMLNELNLIDLSKPETTGDMHKLAQQGHRISQQQNQKNPVLRLRRYSNPMVDFSSTNASGSSNGESWASRVVSTLKSRLPSWISPKVATTTTPGPHLSTTSMAPHSRGLSSESSSPHWLAFDTPRSRMSTARRSAQSPAPMISMPSGIPAGAHLNILSKQLELGGAQNGSTNLNTSQHQQVSLTDAPHHRLVLLLRICVHHMSSRRDSEMSVIEVGVLSGFKPNEADLKEIINDVGTPAMKYELSPDRSLVVIYMQYIPFSGPFCLQFRLIRDSLVYNLQSGYIRVYEYYSPTHSCSNFYTPSRVSDLIETNCDSSGQVCQCAARSLCPSTRKLIDLSEIHQVNATSARNQLVDLVCSSRFDLVSLVRLKSVRHLEAGKMFKLSVKIKSDLKGNLTMILEAQRQQKVQLVNSIRKPQHNPIDNPLGGLVVGSPATLDSDNTEETSLDHLTLSIDSSCVRDDPLLLHLAHPSQWKQGGELMILFGRYDKLEKRHFRVAPKSANGRQLGAVGPRPKPSIVFSQKDAVQKGLLNQEIHQPDVLSAFDDSQQLQYSLTMPLDKNSILHDITYQAKVGPREAINNLILWLELRSRREKWSCPQ